MKENLSQRSQHVPDILDVIAALSSNSIPTPPVLASAMLDLLPPEVWTNPELKWLDPSAKSGSILREVVRRLMLGLTEWQPDAEKRAQHILKEMVFGSAQTKIHGEMSRRSVYVSRDASSPFSVVNFDEPEGNIPFVEARHSYPTNKQGRVTGPCSICSAPASLERGNSRENYADAFIHGAYPTKEMEEMKFDVIVGNPPYQTGDGKTSESPLYHHFIEASIQLNPKYLAMIVPSRWFNGGKGLDDFRAKMIQDRRLRAIVDNPKRYDCFPGVVINGGVNYFLWDRDYEGDCEFSVRVDGEIVSSMIRDLRLGDGVLIRDNRASSIISRCSPSAEENSLSTWVSSQFPFGQALTTNFSGAKVQPFDGSIPLIFGSHVGYISPDQIQKNKEWVRRWKVIIPKAGDGNGQDVNYVIGEPIALAPGSVCTQTYLVAGTFDSATEAENYANFLTTKLVRFLVLQRKSTQDIRPDKFRFVEKLDMSRPWTDSDLFAHYGLTEEEVDYVLNSIHLREAVISVQSPVPQTHLPGGNKYRPPGSRDASEGPELSYEDDE